MTSNLSNGNGKDNNGKEKLARLCHVIKREDFDGYGFNLHAEKGKPGQYIGKVDDESPAEVAGLRQGDRIIEVNGVNIGNETHKQVVQRIKAIACEVQLLVVDPSLVTVASDNQIIGSSDVNNGQYINDKATPYGTTTPDELSSPPPPPPPSALSINASGIITSSDGVNNKLKIENGGEVKSSQNSTTTSNNVKKVASGEGLNLRMTAAELRAKLAAKKKYDPKADAVDLRKKYDIVQKL